MPAKRSRPKLKVTLLPTDPYESAKIAGLRYVTDELPGIRRKRTGKGFMYVDANGALVRNKEVLGRIRSLVIPPAWGNVWICASSSGHIQAVGFDQRGRKQYRYHPLYRAVRDATKFTRLVAFGLALPKIRERVAEDLKATGMPRVKVLAAVVRLLEDTCIRVGNEEYAKQNESFGLTTLRNKHVQIDGQTLRFRFKGKSGQMHDVELMDRRLAGILRECQCIPGQELFQFIGEDGEPSKITSEDVNDYLRAITGEDFTAKDFRTWSGTREGTKILESLGPVDNQAAARKNIVEAVKQTARTLGNRPATCKKYYIHPAILEAYTDGSLFEVLNGAEPQDGPHGLKREEVAMMQLLAMHKPEPLKIVEQEKDLTQALKKSVEQVINVAEIEIIQPTTAVA
jgi:DNA topoisomerase I